MLVIDAMHCILEGLVHYHCRRVLELESKPSKASSNSIPAYPFSWPIYDPAQLPVGAEKMSNVQEVRGISEIHRLLMSSLHDSSAINDLKRKLVGKNKKPLQYVWHSLRASFPNLSNHEHPRTKADFAELLIQWVRLIYSLVACTHRYMHSVLPCRWRQLHQLPSMIPQQHLHISDM